MFELAGGVRAFFESEIGYVFLLAGLFVVTKVLQRWRLPSAITSFVLGAGASLGFGLFTHDETLHLLATFGIVGLFLFAGLDVDWRELRSRQAVIGQHLAIRLTLLAGVAYAIIRLLHVPVRPGILTALALVTPSTGFILDSLNEFGLTADERFWVRTKAVSSELIALAVLFVALQSSSLLRLGGATLGLLAIVAITPALFRLFARLVVPYAPRSEFAFLVMMALVAAYATRHLGVYYLVGAFIVGVAARQLRDTLPKMEWPPTLHAIEAFASFFAPFYFFVAGTSLRREDLSLTALWLGVAFFVVLIPVRIGTKALHRRLSLREPLRRSIRVALPLQPTLVFTLVLVGILRDSFELHGPIPGALVVYAVLNTLVPGLVFGAPTDFDTPELPHQMLLEEHQLGGA